MPLHSAPQCFPKQSCALKKPLEYSPQCSPKHSCAQKDPEQDWPQCGPRHPSAHWKPTQPAPQPSPTHPCAQYRNAAGAQPSPAFCCAKITDAFTAAVVTVAISVAAVAVAPCFDAIGRFERCRHSKQHCNQKDDTADARNNNFSAYGHVPFFIVLHIPFFWMTRGLRQALSLPICNVRQANRPH